jgi:hypothetical protein
VDSGIRKLEKRCTRVPATSDKVYQLFAHGRWFSSGTPPFSISKTGRHDIAEILLKVALNTIKQTRKRQCADIVKFEYFKVVALKKSIPDRDSNSKHQW